MNRREYEPTEKQIENWSKLYPAPMPTDDEFKAQWKRQHHGKESGWGMGKRNWVALHKDDNLTCNADYERGVWQGRLDAALGLDMAETPHYHTDAFEHGYYSGYTNFASFWPQYSRTEAGKNFIEKYGVTL